MSFDDFISKYNGKGIDYDGAFSTQCMDLYRQYVKEVLGYPQSPAVPGAKDVWNTYLPEYYKRIDNTPSGVPDKGDIVIWGEKIGKYGHIAVFVDGNEKKFNSFDQNFPVGSLCHIQSHTYTGVLGWLRPSYNITMDIPDWLKTLLTERGLTITNESEIRAIFEKAKNYDDEIHKLQEQVKSSNETLADKALEVSLLTQKTQSLISEKDELQEQLNKARSERNQADAERQRTTSELNETVATLNFTKEQLDTTQKQLEGLRIALESSHKKNLDDIGLFRFIYLKYLKR